MDAGQVGSTGGLAVCLEHRTPTHPPLLLLLGGSTWRPSWISGACATQPPATRSWRWPGTWNCLRGKPCHPLGTVPSSRTSLCPARLSAWVSLSSRAASPSPSWPGPAWPVYPGSGLRLHHGLGPNAETSRPSASVPPIFAADTQSSWLPAWGHRPPRRRKAQRSSQLPPKIPMQKRNGPEGARTLSRPGHLFPAPPP